MRTRLPQFATLIPLLGYAVLWGDQFQDVVLKFERAFGTRGIFSPIDRVQFLYFGSVLILCGMLAYWVLCPSPLRFGSRRSYLSAVSETADPREAQKAGIYLRPRVSKGKALDVAGVQFTSQELGMAEAGQVGATTIRVQSAYYEALDIGQPLRSGAAFVLLIGGTALFLVPSIEVFLLALSRLAGLL